tara:strand:+ start:144 stop:521 length:378 start_codon:yes stop_codon:yes gene_type:complete
MELIKFNFFTQEPIDFEYKKYKVLSYTVESDRKYVEMQFSPWLNNNKLLVLDLKNFMQTLNNTRRHLTKKRLQFGDDGIYYEKIVPESLETLSSIERTILYSIPIIERSNQFGQELANQSGAILW